MSTILFPRGFPRPGLALALFLFLLGQNAAWAISCWAVSGWSSTSYVGAQAVLSPALCTTAPTPPGGWVQVTLNYGSPPTAADSPLWLLIPPTDTHLSGGSFNPLLVFAGYDTVTGKPIVKTDVIVGGGGNTMQVYTVAPQQGTAACTLPPNGTMVAWHAFDESSGAAAADLAAGNTATVYNGSWIAGLVSNALYFNGASTYAEAPSTMNLNFGPANTPAACATPLGGAYSACLGDFSIDAWVKLPPTTPNNAVKIIVDKRNPATVQGYSFFLGQNGRLGLQMGSGGSFANYSSVPGVPYDNNWHQVGVTVDRRVGSGAFGLITWYIDGMPAGTASTTVLGSLVNNTNLRVGTRTAASPLTGWFTGGIDELEIFNRVLTAAEVKNIYLAGALGKCKPALPTPPPAPCGGNPSTC